MGRDVERIGRGEGESEAWKRRGGGGGGYLRFPPLLPYLMW